MSDRTSDSEEEMVTLHELLEQSARAALGLQREDGSFPPGQNGVYDEPETPVRTTSHWLTTLSKVYEITGDGEFADAANDAANYLLSDEARPYGHTFHSRNAKGKDKCDGLVGQAAPIRGLAWAGSALKRPELLETAVDVFSLHPFDNNLGLWQRIEIDGTNLSFDRTLNHQILFAGAAAHLASEYRSVEKIIESFVNRLESNVETRSDGIIRHYVRPPLLKTIRTVTLDMRHWEMVRNDLISRYYTYSSKRKRKEIGYHPVNLLGIAHIQKNMELIDFQDYNSRIIKEATSYSAISKVDREDISHGGMTPGIDIAIALHELRTVDHGKIRQWIEVDLQNMYDTNSGLLSRKSEDPAFQSASISYLVDLPNQKVTI